MRHWQCGMRTTAKAADGLPMSGVPIPGCQCHSPLPLGPAFAFQEIGLGPGCSSCQPLPGPAGGPGSRPLTVTALGGLLVGDGRVTAGASELGPAMPDGESGFLSNYCRPGSTIIRDYSRRGRSFECPGLRRLGARIKAPLRSGLSSGRHLRASGKTVVRFRKDLGPLPQT
jgi:hypothetical protein